MKLDWIHPAQGKAQHDMILRDPQKKGNSKDQRLKNAWVRKTGNLVSPHVFNYSTDPDSNTPSCSTPRNNVSWADNEQYILQTEGLEHYKTTHYCSLPAPCIFKLMQVVHIYFHIILLKTLTIIIETRLAYVFLAPSAQNKADSLYKIF